MEHLWSKPPGQDSDGRVNEEELAEMAVGLRWPHAVRVDGNGTAGTHKGAGAN